MEVSTKIKNFCNVLAFEILFYINEIAKTTPAKQPLCGWVSVIAIIYIMGIGTILSKLPAIAFSPTVVATLI